MMLVQESAGYSDTISPSQKQSVQIVETIDGLATIHKPDAELVIWQRSLPPGLQDWIDAVEDSNLPHIRLLIKSQELCSAIVPHLDACDFAAGEMRDLLLEDIEVLVNAFADITRSDYVDVRLERINDDACWKFHRDAVDARLITTYRGPTTEWVQMADAERTIDEQIDYNGPLERLEQNDVALFKGSQAGLNSGVVHRSPQIEGTDCTRLLLCLNKRTVVSPDPWSGM